MKITQQEKAFTPVSITLETQEEVDALFAVFNFSPIFDTVTKGKQGEMFRGLYIELSNFADNYRELHEQLDAELTRKG